MTKITGILSKKGVGLANRVIYFGPYSVRTNSNGLYSIEIPPGTYQVVIDNATTTVTVFMDVELDFELEENDTK
jgi:hypothetical protein